MQNCMCGVLSCFSGIPLMHMLCRQTSTMCFGRSDVPTVMEGELPLLDRWGRLQRKKGYDDGFKKGAAKAKKENQQHLDASAFMLQYGRRLSGRAMHELRMLASESVTQAKTRRTADLEMEQSGEKIAQLQGGEWAKDRANFDKVLKELDKR